MTIASIGDMSREIANRCRDLGLALDCGCDGLFNAEIAVVAEAPGERERIMKIPLCGTSGKLLWDMVRPIGINRRSVYITNVVKRQLRQTDDEKVSITRNEVDHYASIVRWELEQLPSLRYILVLGNYALEAVTGLTGIMHHRRSVYDTSIRSVSQGGPGRDVKVIALLNPAAVIREPKWEIMYKFDVARVKRVLDGEYKQHTVDAIINPSPREASLWIDRMQDEKLPVALDIETIGGETACVGLANSTTTGMCINWRDRGTNRYSVREECDLRLRLQRFVSDETTRLVMQNGMFDSYWLACKDRLFLRESYFDTMLAHHTLYPSLPHNLGFLTSQYTEHPFYKDDGKEWREGGDIDTFWRYNVTDCCITLAVSQKEHTELRAQRLEDFFFQHVMRLQPHLINMTVGGIKIDEPLKKQIGEDLAVEVHKLKEQFFTHVAHATGDPDYKPNPRSPKQMSELFFRRLRLVGRGIATDAKNRARMRSHPRTTEDARLMIDSIDKWAKEDKFLSTYAEMTIDIDGKARCEYKQTGVQSAPGRLSSTSTMWGSGMNLQNQPHRAYKMFIAQDGYGFSYFDLAQAEARVVAWRANITKWMEQFERARLEGGYDAHKALASEMWNIPYSDVPDEDFIDFVPTIRFKAKRSRHGLNYIMGPETLHDSTGIPIRECEEIYRIYHRVTPELQAWWDWTFDYFKKNREMFNAYGRRYMMLERLDQAMLGNLVAFYPQGTIGDKVSRCIYLCHDDPEWPTGKARMVLTIHDALVALHSLEPGIGETVRRVMKRHAEEPLYITDIKGTTRELIIPADLKASVADEHGVHRWSTLQKVKVL